MPGLLALLQNSAMSLQAHQAFSATVAHNLANAQTPGYARQRAELATALPAERYGNGYIGTGAILQGVTQSRDRFLEAQLPDSLAREQFSSAQATALQGVSALDPSGGLATAIGNFYSQLRALAQNPGSMNYREAAVSASKQLALAFNQTGTSLAGARSALDDRLGTSLPEINDELAQVAHLNVQIRQASATGVSPNDLLDARQKRVDSLARKLGATPVPSREGDVNLVFANGVALVAGGKSSSLSTLPDVANGGHLALRVTLPDGSGPSFLSNPVGGELGGLLAARDGAMATAERRVDQLAFDLGGALNTIHAAAFALDGSTGRNLFGLSATATGAARAMTLDSAVDADAGLFAAASAVASLPGDGGAAAAMVGTEMGPLTGGLSVTTTLADLTAQYGSTTRRAAAMSEGDAAMLAHLSEMRESASGVSIDEELVNMRRAQAGYEAISKVMKTADEMLSTLMSLRP
jgi:flagellar hook-associated protein 1 FlgK